MSLVLMPSILANVCLSSLQSVRLCRCHVCCVLQCACAMILLQEWVAIGGDLCAAGSQTSKDTKCFWSV